MKPGDVRLAGVVLVVVGLAAILIAVMGTDIEDMKLSVPVTEEAYDEVDLSLARYVIGGGFILMGLLSILVLLRLKRRNDNVGEDEWKRSLRRK